MTGAAVKIYIVHEYEHLMKRDQEDFEVYWVLLGVTVEVILYKAGLDFKAEPGSLIIFDEADTFMLKHTGKFAALIDSCFCICLTATPDDGDAKGLLRIVVGTLQFTQFNYVLDDELANQPTLMEADIIDAPSIDGKAAKIMQQLETGPVLSFCDEELAEKLCSLMTAREEDAVAVGGETSLIKMMPNTDFKLLRSLDRRPFKLIVATGEFAMRGIDYRCPQVVMTLFIGKSFSCKVEALQGMARVGRYKD